MSKVKVDKKTYEQLNDYLSVNNKNDFLRTHTKGHWVNYYEFNKFNHIELAEILINGYEVEETPEEKLVDWYKSLSSYKCSYASDNVRLGINETLEILNIKIEGINE